MTRARPSRRYAANRAGNHAKYRPRRRWPWITLACSVVILGTLAGFGYVFAKEALSVKADLMAAQSELSGLTAVVKAGDTKKLDATSERVLVLTNRAKQTVDGPLWDIAGNVPFVGQNVVAVKSATEAVDILAREAMPPAMELLGTMDVNKLKLAGGGVSLEPFKNAITVLPEINSAFTHAKSKVSGIDRKALLPVVDGSIGKLLTVIDQAGPALSDLQKNLPTLLELAGSKGPRTYIVIFQNNAEIRATGGNAANSAEISVDNGKIEMLDNEDTKAFKLAGYNGRGSYKPGPKTMKLYESDFTTNAQNYSRTPDFPTTAQMFAKLWKQTTGKEAAGVISVDPVVLAYMLRVTGPVTLADGSQLTAENAVKTLLSDAYERFGVDGAASDAFFADAASRVFKKLSSGGWGPTAMLDALQSGVNEQRIYAWFPAPDEQALAVSTHVDGALAQDNVKATQVGVYLNDASYSKLEYYLRTKTTVTCDATARTVTTAVTMTSTVPGPKLSGYTLAWRNGSLHQARTTMFLDVLGFAVPGGKLTSEPAAGDFQQFGSFGSRAPGDRTGVESGRQGKSLAIMLPMGSTKTVAYTSTLPEGPLGPLQVRFSPTVGGTDVTIAKECSSLFPSK